MCRDCRTNVYSYTTRFDVSNLPVILRRPVFDDPEAPVHCDRAPRGLDPFANVGAGTVSATAGLLTAAGKSLQRAMWPFDVVFLSPGAFPLARRVVIDGRGGCVYH